MAIGYDVCSPAPPRRVVLARLLTAEMARVSECVAEGSPLLAGALLLEGQERLVVEHQRVEVCPGQR